VAKRRAPRDDAAPAHCRCVLLLVDVINDLEFPGGARLLSGARRLAKTLAPLAKRAREQGIPVIYANDNFGHWRSDFRAQVEHCLHDEVRGGELAAALAPQECDYFVLKPRHSAFYSTALETLLRHLGAKVIVLAGIAGDNCVLFTAHDAYMRDYRLIVPRDGIASESAANNAWALRHMRRFLKVETPRAKDIDLLALASVRKVRRSVRGVVRTSDR